MRESLRKALIDSHVAAATIAILLFLSLDGFYVAGFALFSRLLILIQWAARGYAPYPPVIAGNLFAGVAGAAGVVLCAWLLSQWICGDHPFAVLACYRGKFSRNIP